MCGLVINKADPYSVAVGAYYAARRGLRPEQILRVDVPVRAILTEAEFNDLNRAIAVRFGPRTQALALAWTAPSAVACNSITGALALGFDAALCSNGCARSRASPYANSPSTRPFTDHNLRPSMLLAARSVKQARALIDRGVASDGSQGLRGGIAPTVALVTTLDGGRRVRERLYPPLPLQGLKGAPSLQMVEMTEAELGAQRNVILAQTGSARQK